MIIFQDLDIFSHLDLVLCMNSNGLSGSSAWSFKIFRYK